MRQVFVHYKNGSYIVIDKANPQTVFAKVNDVLLFNATYKRQGSIKGWHGILSEEINNEIVNLLKHKFDELSYKPKVYYPRCYSNIFYSDGPIKKVTFLRLQDGKETFRGARHGTNIQPFLTEWISKETYDDELDDYGWGEFDDGQAQL